MFKGLGQLGDMSKVMKQAQEMQSKMTEMQTRLESIEVVGESGAGLVAVKCSAKGKVLSIEIDPSILQPSEKEIIEDLIVAAIVDGQEKATVKESEEMASMTASMGLPAGMKLPF